MPTRTSIPPRQVKAAIEHLSGADPRLAAVIAQAGAFGLRLQTDPIEMLIRSIVSQQVSTSAARAIYARVQAIGLDRDGRFSIETLSAKSVEELRAAGLSRQKASYVHDLAAHVADCRLDVAGIDKLSDDEIIDELTKVHGIGVWTAHMFLIFCLGRPDVLPWGDYGIRAAIRNVYRMKELPDRKQVEKIGKRWHPYASVASWYLWRSLEFK